MAKCSAPENIPIYVNFFWHLPSITFVNGFPCVYMCVNKGRRPKKKKKKLKQIYIHTNISNRKKRKFSYLFKYFS